MREFFFKENRLAGLSLGVESNSAGSIHDILKNHCQRYVVSISNHYTLEKIDDYLGSTKTKFPFLEYSIHHLFEHAELAASHGTPQDYFLKEFPFESWLSLHDHIVRAWRSARNPKPSLLYVLTERNLMRLFQIEVSHSQSINDRGGRYDFPIIAAAAVGNNRMLVLLIQHGAKPDTVVDPYEQHALSAAVARSNVRAVEILLKAGAMSCLGIWSMGPSRDDLDDPMVELFARVIDQLVKMRQPSIIRLILRHRTPLVDSISGGGLTSIVTSALEIEDDEIFRTLVESGVVGSGADPEFGYTLPKASRLGKDRFVHMMLYDFAHIRVTRNTYRSALLTAVCHTHESIVRMLLMNGADATTSGEGGTALRTASDNGHETIARTLLAHGANVNTGQPLCSVLLLASHTTCAVMVPMLLEYGADPNQQLSSELGLSLPLHTALSRGMDDMVKLLLKSGADVNISSSKYANAYSALDSCHDRKKRIACKALLPKRSTVQSPVLRRSKRKAVPL
jgi:ankyrin repeat protein